MTPSWYSYGTPGMTLTPTAEGVRTAFDGKFGAHGTYSRWSTNETWMPPYTFTGRMKVRSRLTPFTIGGKPVTYTPSIVWHVASMPDEPGGVNANNLVVGIGGAGAANVGASAELYRPETGRSTYGVRTGYVSRLREPSPDPVDGEWHTFAAVMLAYDRYQLWWDGTLIADIVEKQPASMRGRLSIGLRLDSFDVELADLDVNDGKEIPQPVSQPFDHSRYDWYPPDLCGPGVVCKSDGTPRPALSVPLDTFGVHYGGAGTSWLDFGDTPAELRGIELNHARPNGKPNEYNSVSDSASETWEYAGRFQAAHSAGNNGTVWGHLVLYGLENLTEPQAQGLIRGIRRARAQCVRAGYITSWHLVLPHHLLPGANTSCPGPLWTNKRWWNQIVAALTPDDYGPPTLVPLPPPEKPKEDTMKAIYYPGPAISSLTDVQFAAFESGIIRHCSGPDTSEVAWGKVPRVPVNGPEHFNQLARAANHMSGADIDLLPQ
jgi:hypothetical protein